jgi:hypothetical protein
MHKVTFHGVSTELFDRVLEHALGLCEATIHTNDKELEISGVRAAYHYDANESALTINIITAPEIVTKGYCYGAVYDMICTQDTKTARTP